MRWKSLLRHISPELYSVCMHWLGVGITKTEFPQQKYVCIYFTPLQRYCSYQYAYQQYALWYDKQAIELLDDTPIRIYVPK